MYVYLVQTSDNINTDKYKVGCSSKNDLSRVKGYGKDVRVVYIFETEKYAEIEKEIKNIFSKKFVCVRGSEYFEGDICSMKRIFLDTYIKLDTADPNRHINFLIDKLCHIYECTACIKNSYQLINIILINNYGTITCFFDFDSGLSKFIISGDLNFIIGNICIDYNKHVDAQKKCQLKCNISAEYILDFEPFNCIFHKIHRFNIFNWYDQESEYGVGWDALDVEHYTNMYDKNTNNNKLYIIKETYRPVLRYPIDIPFVSYRLLSHCPTDTHEKTFTNLSVFPECELNLEDIKTNIKMGNSEKNFITRFNYYWKNTQPKYRK